MKMPLRSSLLRHPLAVTLLLLAGAAFALQAARTAIRRHAAAETGELTRLVPPGALLSIESPDFGALLDTWNRSPEQKNWLQSDNYAVFSNSRLFGRLSDAEGEFAQASQIPAATLLPQVAGRQSVFAWYDIGRLEFLYITRMPPAQAARTDLLKTRGKWKAREAGGHAFYVRTATGTDQTQPRTVAFATAGDLLFLATREDLLAGALQLLPKAGAGSADTPAGESLASEPWFQQSGAALPAEASPPMLHMVLNLDRIVPMPYFRSYWVQRNVTEMKSYRAAVSDLYRGADSFREERALLLKDAAGQATGSAQDVDLAPLVSLAPATGAFRARASDDPAEAVEAIEEKLLGRAPLADLPATDAPDPSLTVAEAGSASDLEVRIDAAPPLSAGASTELLSAALREAGQDALLTWSSANQSSANQSSANQSSANQSSANLPQATTGLWLPVHSAVVVEGTRPWNPQHVAAALQQALRGSLTAGNLGIEFQASAGGVYTLTGPKPLVFAVRGQQLVLADDAATLDGLLHATGVAGERPAAGGKAAILAGFQHTAERAPYARLTALIDHTNGSGSSAPEAHATPAFFSQNVRSLSDSFAALASERFSQRHESLAGETVLRQTVIYQWRAP